MLGNSKSEGTRCELKNLNSFRFLAQALAYEERRQRAILEAGGTVAQETRGWEPAEGKSHPQRAKEEAHDYRYFPEPDLPELWIAPEVLERVALDLPELPDEKLTRYVRELGLAEKDARLLAEDILTARFFEAALVRHPNPQDIAKWLSNELFRALKHRPFAVLPFAGAALGELVAMVDCGTITGPIAKKVLAQMVATGASPAAIVEARGWAQIEHPDLLAAIVDEVINDHPDVVTRYRAGKTQVFAFLVGQVITRTEGRGNPQTITALLRQRLGT